MLQDGSRPPKCTFDHCTLGGGGDCNLVTLRRFIWCAMLLSLFSSHITKRMINVLNLVNPQPMGVDSPQVYCGPDNFIQFQDEDLLKQ